MKLSLKDKMKKMTRATVSTAVHYALIVAVIATLAVGVLKLPEVHNHWLHSKVGSRVYKIQDQANGGGGTGFAVKAPSGQSYILTNDHVCGVSADGQSVLVTDDKGDSMRRRIISHDGNSDLCLIEGVPGVEGLSVASTQPSRGDTIYVVGHPRLMPTHVSSGEMLGKEDVTLILGPISVIDPVSGKEEQIDPAKGGILPEMCMAPKNSQENIEINLLFFTVQVKFCMLNVKDTYTTAVTIHPGNSGSPAVNFWGNVEGVAFAGSSETNWGNMLNLKDIKAFLKNY